MRHVGGKSKVYRVRDRVVPNLCGMEKNHDERVEESMLSMNDSNLRRGGSVK